MKLARFAYNGQIHEAVYKNDQLWVGTVAYDPDDVMWLPPVDARGCTAVGVALGYADHAAELKLDVPDYPLLFHKLPNTFIGHKAKVIRPNVEYMHYEGELVVVMGQNCRSVNEEDALNYVYGYTIEAVKGCTECGADKTAEHLVDFDLPSCGGYYGDDIEGMVSDMKDQIGDDWKDYAVTFKAHPYVSGLESEVERFWKGE